MLLAEPAGRSLERTGNRASRGMIVHDRTRLIGQLLLNISRIHLGMDPVPLTLSYQPNANSAFSAAYSDTVGQGMSQMTIPCYRQAQSTV